VDEVTSNQATGHFIVFAGFTIQERDSKGTLIGEFTPQTTRVDKLKHINGLAADNSGNIIISDRREGVFEFSQRGTSIIKLTQSLLTDEPWGITRDAQTGQILVAE